ncbi:hypothetical protein C8R45DRAFT_1013750 [Mycena sanguinolenta]|nr:hypothetical protein C8R45DRAFT_1013750 [Mycena sanguinolenta]
MVHLYLFWEFFNRLLQDQISDLEYANTFSKPLHRSLAQFTTSCRGAWHRGDTVHRSYGPQPALNCPGFCALRPSPLGGAVAALPARCCPLNPGSLCFACVALATATLPLHLAARVPVQRCNGPVVRQRGYVAGILTWSHQYQISAFGIAGARVSQRRGRQLRSQWRAAPYRRIGRGTGAQPIRVSGNATDGVQCFEKVYLYRNITSIHFVTF